MAKKESWRTGTSKVYEPRVAKLLKEAELSKEFTEDDMLNAFWHGAMVGFIDPNDLEEVTLRFANYMSRVFPKRDSREPKPSNGKIKQRA